MAVNFLIVLLEVYPFEKKELFYHLPIPEIAFSNFHQFGSLKSFIRGEKFENEVQLKTIINALMCTVYLE